MVAALSVGHAQDEVSFQWCSKPPYEEFSTDFVESSNESIEDLLQKYKRRPKREIPTAAAVESSAVNTCTGCHDVGDAQTPDVLGGILGEWLMKRQDSEAKVTKIRAAAAVFKTRFESELKKQEALEKRLRFDRKKALHHIPDSRERREAERRLRKKYTALQVER